jgi:hypothetical protein
MTGGPLPKQQSEVDRVGSSSERRKFPRVASESIVSITRLDPRQALAHTVDLSAGGLRFHCFGLSLREGDLVKVTLTLGERTLALHGRLVRVASLDQFTQDVAVQFVRLDAATQAALAPFLPDSHDCPAGGRREFPRLGIETTVSVALTTPTEVVAQACDLSEGGARFVIEGVELDEGDVVRIALRIGGEERMAVGRLVRLTDLDGLRQECAVAFLDADPGLLEQLREEAE